MTIPADAWSRLAERIYSERRASWVMPGAMTLIVIGGLFELAVWAWRPAW